MSPRLLPAAAAVLALTACDGIPQRLAEAPPLNGSTLCQAGSQQVVGRAAQTPVATMVMNNDGGWCWMMSTETDRGFAYGPFLRVTRQPEFGTLEIAVLKTQTRVAYRPNPGFVGTDGFQTVSQELNYQVNYLLTVTK